MGLNYHDIPSQLLFHLIPVMLLPLFLLHMHQMHPSNRGSSSTVFYQIAKSHAKENRRFDYNCIGIQHAGNIRLSFETAKKFKVKHILADELHQGLQEKCFDFVDRVVDENDKLYIQSAIDRGYDV